MVTNRGHRFARWAILAGAALLCGGLAIAPGMTAAQDSALDPAQEDAVRALVRDYILENPEVILESLRAHQTRAEAEGRRQAQAAVAESRQVLEKDSMSPVAGNPDGDVTVIEFFDYNCGFCRRVLPDVQAHLEADGNVRYVFKEFPILGQESVDAARVALAVFVVDPDAYLPFHAELMQSRGTVDRAKALQVAAEMGIDPVKLEDAMADPRIDAALRSNLELARQIDIRGTPAFVIGDEVLPGAVGLETLQELVAGARGA